MDRAGFDRSSAPSSGISTPRTPRPEPSHLLPCSPAGQPLPSRTRCLAGRPLRRSWGDLLAHWTVSTIVTYHKILKILYGWVDRGRGDFDQPNPVRRLATPKGEHPLAPGGPEPRVSDFARRRQRRGDRGQAHQRRVQAATAGGGASYGGRYRCSPGFNVIQAGAGSSRSGPRTCPWCPTKCGDNLIVAAARSTAEPAPLQPELLALCWRGSAGTRVVLGRPTLMSAACSC